MMPVTKTLDCDARIRPGNSIARNDNDTTANAIVAERVIYLLRSAWKGSARLFSIAPGAPICGCDTPQTASPAFTLLRPSRRVAYQPESRTEPHIFRQCILYGVRRERYPRYQQSAEP